MYNTLFDLAISSLTSAISLYLTYKIFTLILILWKNYDAYIFGSPEWLHWIQHVAATVICFIGSSGLTTMHLMNTIQRAGDHEQHETIINSFVMLILLAMLIFVNHVRAEETPDNYVAYNKNRRKNDKATKENNAKL